MQAYCLEVTSNPYVKSSRRVELGDPTYKELVLGTFRGENADAFTVRLSRQSLDSILHRMDLFRQCRILDLGVHEMVFEDALGGYFFSQERTHPRLLEPGEGRALGPGRITLANEIVICDFADDLAGWSSKDAAEQKHFPLAPAETLVAVQWRTYDFLSEVAYYSHPLWEDELQQIRSELTARMRTDSAD